MMTICKGQSTKNITTPTDSLRRLLPKGYVIFTEAAARLALQNKSNSEAYLKQFQESQKINDTQTLQINVLLEENSNLKSENRRLKFKKTLEDIEKWAYRILIIMGSGYIAAKK